MGLLKNLLKAVAGDAIDKIKENIEQTVKTNIPQQQAPKPAPQKAVSSQEPPQRSELEWKAYFREIIQTSFPGYIVRENVPVTDIAGFVSNEFQLYKTRPRKAYKAEWGQPYSFVLYQGAAPAAVVMLGAGHSHDSNVKYLIARMFAKQSGLPYINFYTQMPNEQDYVVSRIRKFL